MKTCITSVQLGKQIVPVSEEFGERSSALQYPHFSDFYVHYSSALKKLICIFSYVSPNNILFNLVLLGGTLCKWNHTESIIQRLNSFDVMFWESSTLMCITVVHVLALL